MITFKKLTIQNFLSFGHMPTEINLETNEITLILGENKDVGAEGYSRNGVGKSSIFQALTWVLFNEGISTIKQDAFVNIVNKKKMVIELTIMVGDTEFFIRRGRKPAICEVLKDGEPYTMHSSATVDETIEKLIGVNFDTWCNAIMLNTTTIPFMGMKPSPQRDFMEKMVGLDVLSERANKLKSRNKDILIDIKLEEQNKTHVNNNYLKVKERIDQLDNQSKNWVINTKGELDDLTEECVVLKLIDTEKTLIVNQAIREHKKTIDKVKLSISEIDQKKSDDESKALTTADMVERSAITESNKLVAKLEADYNTEVINIKSKHQENRSKFESESNAKSTDMVSERNEKEKSLIEKNALLKESTNFIINNAKILREFIDKETELNREWNTLSSGVCPYCNQKHVDENKIEEIISELQQINKDAEEIGNDNDRVTDGINELKEEISIITDEVSILTESLDRIHSDLNKLLVKSQSEQGDELTTLESTFETNLKKLDDVATKDLSDLNAEYESALVIIGMEAAENKEQFEKELVLLEDDLKDEVYSDAECAEIVSTIKQLNIRMDTLTAATNPYTEQLTQAQDELVEYNDDALKHMYAKTDHYKILIKMLTDNKSFVRKNLLDQYVPFINSKIGEYTTKLELPHVVTINNDLSVDIEYMQSSVSYGNLSNGESRRLQFAVSMAFRDLLSVSGKQFNFLGIDELLDNGIDTSGFHAIFNLLETHEKESVFLISHRDDLITEVDNIMTVIKENGFTKIKERPATWETL